MTDPLSLPHARHVEAVALGLAMGDPDALHALLSGLAPTDYAHAPHSALHALLTERAAGAETVSLMEDVVRRGADRYGGLPYICEIQDAIPSYRRDPAPLVREIRDLSVRRQVAALGVQMSDLVRGREIAVKGEPVRALSGTEAVEIARSALDAIATTNDRHSVQILEPLLAEDARIEAGGTVAKPTPTGIDELDDALLGGLWPTDLVVCGGRPGWGKTALALVVALEAAIQGRSVAFYPMEMPAYQVAQRAVSVISGVPLRRIVMADELTTADWTEILEARAVLADLPFRIDERSSLNAAQIITQSRALGADLTVVDYLQRMDHPTASRLDIAMGATAVALKNFAKDSGSVVWLNVQLNRAIDQRRTKGGGAWIDDMGWPRKSDIREAGGVEQEADVILFPIRPTDEVASREELTGQEAGIVIAKHRRGQSDLMVDVHFDGPTTKFSSKPTGGPRDML